MSLFKAYKNTNSVRTFTPILQDFKQVLEAVMVSDEISEHDVVPLVKYYAEYSVTYLTYVATNLTDPKDAQQTMKFMNSYIAEACHHAGIHYYNREHGYSIIDKAVQAALDNGGTVGSEAIIDIIKEIEDSFIEPEEEFEVPEELLAAKGA